MKQIPLIVAAVALVQWLVFATLSAMSHARFPKKGRRPSETRLIVSSSVLAAMWIVAMGLTVDWTTRTQQASVAATSAKTSHGSCASIDSGMTAADVRTRLGEPDQTVPDEETRGPGAKMLVYKEARCVVHLFDDKVESIE